MARNEKKLQQKLMKKRQKEKAKKKHAAQARVTNTENAIIRRSNQYPIHECLISADWRTEGMAVILVASQQKENRIVFGVYMVDLYCLGVKNTFARANLSLSEHQGRVKGDIVEQHDAAVCSPELAHQIICGALDYAANLDLQPHRDFRLSRHVLDAPETISHSDDIEFGKDGKPLYVSGPHDQVSKILKHLETKLGPEGFHFIVGGPPEFTDEYEAY